MKVQWNRHVRLPGKRRPNVVTVTRKRVEVVEPAPESGVVLGPEPKPEWKPTLRKEVEGEFRKFGVVDNGDRIIVARGERRVA